MQSTKDQFNQLKELVNSKKTERLLIRKEIGEIQKTLTALESEYAVATKSRKWIQAVAAKTQEQISSSVGSLVTKALSSVFENPYEFKVSFVPRRNKTECDLFFVREGNEVDPLDASGGGAVDITSFALRATFRMLGKDTRPILILDEPFKFVSADLQPFCSAMLKAVSDELHVQVIMVSHLPSMINCADTVIKVSNVNGISEIQYKSQQKI